MSSSMKAEIQRLKKEIKKLEKLVYLDPLTNIYNRRAFLKIGGNYFNDWQYNKNHNNQRKNTIQNLALIFLDIDDFKKINDRYGHQKGDQILKSFAKNLQKLIRKTDILARWGGEEFVILLLNINAENAKAVIHKIITQITQTKMNKIFITLSAGLIIPSKKDSLAKTIQLADRLMYQAKKQGKNQYVATIRRN